MSFYDELDKVAEILRQRGRASYRALRRELHLDEAILQDIRAELVDVQRVAREENGAVLVWVASEGDPTSATPVAGASASAPAAPPSGVGVARRQVTVMLCDLVRSTELAGRLDPEDLRDLLRAYQDGADEVVRRFGGVIARCVGDGLLIYFGYPAAHEDDAERAVRAGLGVVEAVAALQARLSPGLPVLQAIPLQVRVGVHTGLAVIGALNDDAHGSDMAAVGETPSLAAAVQACAAPGAVLISETTYRLLRGALACEALGPRARTDTMPSTPLYRVLHGPDAVEASRRPAPSPSVPLVGRDREAGLLRERWAQVKEGRGQVVLITGEAGIGKSRLVTALTADARSDPHLFLETRGLPYHRHSALYPVTELLRQALEVDRSQSAEARLARLEQAVRAAGLSPGDAVPFLAPLVALPLPLGPHEAPAMSPERLRRRTLEAVLSLIHGLARENPLFLVVEDLHWVDPSTLDWLTLLVEQVAAARLLVVLTARPEFSPPWPGRTHVAPLTLSRLRRTQIERLILDLAGGKALPPAVVDQVVAKTDGVPLFVEELTAMVLESGLLREAGDRYDLVGPLPPLAIPATLQDSLMARLDRLATVKGVAQIGAIIGRSFPYALLAAVSGLGDDTLRRDLGKLVEAELLYQRGVPPEATYTFKHALIQDAAYETLLRSTRQHYHQRIAQALEAGFPELVESHPELLAQHYTSAGLGAEAIPYWQRAGEHAAARAADLEAVSHLSRALELLEAQPPGPQRTQREIALRLARGAPLMAARGHASPEVEAEYRRARALCQDVEDGRVLFRVLGGLYVFYLARGELATARELAQQCADLAERGGDAVPLVRISAMLGQVWFYVGDSALAQAHLERGIALYRAGHYRPRPAGPESIVVCLTYSAWVLWLLGFPDQARARTGEALALAGARAHAHDLAAAFHYANVLDQLRGDPVAVEERAEALIALAGEHGYPLWLGFGHLMRGWAQVARDRIEAGIGEMREGLAALRNTGQGTGWPYYLALMAAANQRLGNVEEARRVQADALEIGRARGEHCWDAELHRLEGELLLEPPRPDRVRAEACFQQAIDVARRHGARSWELRAATSLSRLLRAQGPREAASQVLTDAYGRFTEGFETTDLRHARAELDAP